MLSTCSPISLFQNLLLMFATINVLLAPIVRTVRRHTLLHDVAAAAGDKLHAFVKKGRLYHLVL